MTSSFGRIYLGNTLVSSGQSATASIWVRPAAWPAIPTVLASEQKIVGLHAVWPGDGIGNGGNFFAFTATGAYTIDFGDGTVTNFASNTQANYEFNFNNATLADTNRPVTFTASTNRVNRTAHGLTTATEIQFYNIATTTGISEGQSYYVINPTADSFQIASTPGGSAVTLTNNGSATLLPYRVAIITITPQTGQNLTVVNFQAKNTQTGLQAYSTGWLDLSISVPNVTGSNFTFGGTSVVHRLVERVTLVAYGALTNMSSMFYGCTSLQSIPALNMSGISSTGSAANIVNGNSSIARAPVTGMRFSFSVANCKLSAAAINEIFTGLPTVTGQTITVTGNYGISQAGYDPTIATAKGWTVTA